MPGQGQSNLSNGASSTRVLDRCHHIQCVLPSHLDRSDSGRLYFSRLDVIYMSLSTTHLEACLNKEGKPTIP